MLFLLFELDNDRYALDAMQIAEVVALIPTKKIPGAPAWIAGVLERNGAMVPVVDLSQLALGRPARPLRSTRLVLIPCVATQDRLGDRSAAANGGAVRTNESQRLLGLILERATRMRRIDRERFAATGIATPNARWLGPVASEPDGLVQWVDPRQMIDEETRALLFLGTDATAVRRSG